MLMRCTTVSKNGVFQFNPGPATRANFPSRCTMATCAVSTVKNEPITTDSTKIKKMPRKNKITLVVASIFTLLAEKTWRSESRGYHVSGQFSGKLECEQMWASQFEK